MKEDLTEEELELETLEVEGQVVEAEVKAKIIKPNPEQIASRQRAHDIKVAKFLTGGK